ncbi:MAG: fused response regulator/phosphatase [Rhodospirillaceae bacterium]
MTISLDDCRVLIVDDNEFNRKSLSLLLRRSRITKLEFATDGVEGLAKVDSFRPDLVLLDVAMPNMDGLEMCRRLRADSRHAELPILFQTALDSDEEQVACFQAGGNDFISKPIKPGECLARVRHQLERRKLFNDLSTFRERVQKELQHAHAMQLSLLPERRSLAQSGERYGLDIFSHFETSSELGGDLWSVFEIDEDRVGFLIVDFAGHGITAAINTFRLHTLFERIPAREHTPGKWLELLNASLKDVLPTGQFSTAFYCVLDKRTDILTFAGAGAPNPILGHDGELELLDSSGLLLGISRRATYREQQVKLPPGGFLLLYSDALIECRDTDGVPFGQDAVLALVSEASMPETIDPVQTLLEPFLARVPRPLRDDLTLIWIRRRLCSDDDG